MFKRLFVEHPSTVGESYFQHMRRALGFAVVMFGAATALVLHAIVPACFVKTGSRAILSLHDRMTSSRHRQASADDAGDFVI